MKKELMVVLALVAVVVLMFPKDSTTTGALYCVAFEISSCSILDQPGATYYLTADIIDSTASTCMNITANNIVLDCQGHTIDGIDASNTYGIYVSRTSATNTIITVKNCVVTDWYWSRFEYSNNNTIINSTFNSNTNFGIYLYYSSNNTIINSTFNSNNYDIYLATSSNNNIIINSTCNSKYGIDIDSSSNNQIINSTFNSNYYGIKSGSPSNNQIIGSTFKNDNYGIYMIGGNCFNNIIHSNKIQDSSVYGIYVYSCFNNTIYNNLFNNTNNFYIGGIIWKNYWNTTKQTGERVYSPGNYIGGNYWTNSTGNGYSDTCTDSDKDGVCDNYYQLSATGPNIDYLPLSPDSTLPNYSLNSTNSTIAGTAVSHNLYWQDDAGLSYAIFSFDNCTGSLKNITGMSLSGTSAWSNFTVTINSTVGCTIRWCVYANDTSNNWNGTSCSQPFSYTTISVPPDFCFDLGLKNYIFCVINGKVHILPIIYR
jgi:parallel beta-helix repeat protein